MTSNHKWKSYKLTFNPDDDDDDGPTMFVFKYQCMTRVLSSNVTKNLDIKAIWEIKLNKLILKKTDNEDKRSKETKKTSLEKSLTITATGVLSETK